MKNYYKSELKFKKDYSNYVGMFLMTLAVVGVLYLFFSAVNFAFDRWALSNCKIYNDCEVVLRSIN